jgi:hypothetical protein
MERQYKNAYASLGEERRQEGVPANLGEVVRKKGRKRGDVLKDDKGPMEKFWGFRRDDSWVELPFKMVIKNRKRVPLYLVNKFLIDLAPASTFNPRVSWENMKNAEREAAAAAANQEKSEETKTESSAGKSKASIIQAQNELRANKELYLDTVKIRNMSTSLRNLKDLLPEIKSRRAREILLVEILKKALSEAVVDYCEVYDVLWAIENAGTLTQEAAPATAESNRLLVYDSLSGVNSVLKQARNIRAKEANLTSFQLNEMSSRLPPLSRYNTGGFRLDPWQRQVLEFVDAGKSVVVCAPTSSGKTVLSSYVALIDRSTAATMQSTGHNVTKAAEEEEEVAPDADADEDFDGEDEDEELDAEEGEDGGVEVANAVDSEHFSLIYDNPRANLLLTNRYAVEAAAEKFMTEGLSNARVRQMDRMSRLLLRKRFSDGTQRVLFVVPSEPLVWQVAAYFAKLLREEGDTIGRVGIATNMMTYIPDVKFNTLPQIFVGTPFALESALTKPRGLVGRLETNNKAAGDISAGGFDHFDWAVYDEVHALDGEEGDALQRLIRAMNCKFLALSATVGNAEELRSWLERVKGDQLLGVEEVTALPADATLYAPTRSTEVADVSEKKDKAEKKKHEKKSGVDIKVTTVRAVDGGKQELAIEKITAKTNVETLLERVFRALPVTERPSTPESVCLRHQDSGFILRNKEATLDSLPFYDAKAKEKDVSLVFELLTVTARIIRVGAANAGEEILAKHLSPLSTVLELKSVLWSTLSAEEKLCGPSDLCLRLKTIDSDPAVAVQDSKRSVLPTDPEIILESFMVATESQLVFSAYMELVWFEVKAVRTIDFQRTSISFVSPMSSVLSLKERLIKNWPYFVTEGLQLLCRFAAGDEIHIVACEHAAGNCYLTLQQNGVACDSNLVRDGTVLIVGDDLVKVWKVDAQAPEGLRVRVDHFKTGSKLPVTCTTSDSVVAGENKQRLLNYIPYFSQSTGSSRMDPCIMLEIRSLVNLLQHSARFINLQRYVWDGKLKLLSPLAAVSSVQSLQTGILEECNLSFTSRDSYRLWLQLEKLYPLRAVEHLNPNIFFANDSRITLQRSKDYEDSLKHSMKALAEQFPLETQELLHQFRLEDPPKDFNISDLILSLKKEDKLPGLVFHLNTFDAIQIFKLLLCSLERKQKVAHPYYYTKRSLENDREIEEFLKQQEHDAKVKKDENDEKAVEAEPTKFDVYEPHPNFTYSNLPPLTAKEILDLSDEMEKYDGFKSREWSAMAGAGKGQNKEILGHALIRGLRRGIGLFIDEVSAPAYRRAVQRLASQGKLAVVVSDDSLAFGVNMPFRTCVFCGEMGGALTPLMAQQMSGRAGRRGLDTEGNLVYAGATASFVRDLMIGQVAHITGERFPPKYDTMFLQGLLSPRHTGWSRVEELGGKTLNEFIKGTPLVGSYTLDYSKNVMLDLGLIKYDDATQRLVPVEYWETLSMVWELRFDLPVSICVGSLIAELREEVSNKNREMMIAGKEESRDAKKERLNQYVAFMFAIFIQIFDRVRYDPVQTALPPVQQHSYLADPKKRAVFSKWSTLVRGHQARIPPHLSHLCLPVPVVHDKSLPDTDDASTDPNYVLLDSSLLECMLANKQDFMQRLNDGQKQALKARIWRVGSIIMTISKCLWPRNEYFEVMGDVIHHCFRNLYYLNTELIRYHMRLEDVSSFDRELRTEKDGINFEERPDLTDDPQRNPLVLWKDNNNIDVSESFPVSFSVAAST